MTRFGRAALGAWAAVLGLGLLAPPVGASRAPAHAVVTGTVGRPVDLAGEQVHTVVAVQRWYGGELWVPKAGDAAVTVEVRIRALEETSYNPLYYALEVGGTRYGGVVLGRRAPALRSSNHLAPGATTQGWLTFAVPASRLNGIVLVYTMHAGFGPTLRVPLGRVPDSPRARVGQAFTFEHEQVHTVTRVEHPARLGSFVPPKGQVYVTLYVTVRALRRTVVGARYYSLLAADGTWFKGPLLGRRAPAFPATQSLAPGGVAKGWVTLLAPSAKARSLTLVYHLPVSRADLLVALPA